MSFALVSGVWLVAVAWGLWNAEEVFAPFVGLVWGPVFALTGLATAVWGLVAVLRRRGRGPGWIALLIPAVVCLCVGRFGEAPLQEARLRLRVRDCEPVVARLEAMPAAERENLHLAHTIVARGTPLRIAFVQPGSVLDNFVAVVYDPTGEVLKVNRLKSDVSDRDDAEANRLRTLITSDMVWARHLTGPWYFCGFT